MQDRIPLHPGRIKLTSVDAANGIYDLERQDSPTQDGTPLNKKLLDYAVAACGVTAGTATAYTLNDQFGGFTLVDGAKINFRLHVASGAGATINVNSTGAKGVVNAYNEPIKAGIPAGAWITAEYSEALGKFVLSGVAPNQYSGAVTLSASGWASKKQTVNVANVTATNDVFVSPAPASYKAYTAAGIVCTTQASGKLTFECTSVPTATITVNYRIMHE